MPPPDAAALGSKLTGLLPSESKTRPRLALSMRCRLARGRRDGLHLPRLAALDLLPVGDVIQEESRQAVSVEGHLGRLQVVVQVRLARQAAAPAACEQVAAAHLLSDLHRDAAALQM